MTRAAPREHNACAPACDATGIDGLRRVGAEPSDYRLASLPAALFHAGADTSRAIGPEEPPVRIADDGGPDW